MAKKLTKKEDAARKARYAENRRARAEERRIEAEKAARKAKREANKRVKAEYEVAEVSIKPIDVAEAMGAAEAINHHFSKEDGERVEPPSRSASYYRQQARYDAIAEHAQRNPKRDFVIFDLDGCTADDAWRHQFVVNRTDKNETFHHYHTASANDKALAHGHDLVRNCLLSGMVVIFITARPESYRDLTSRWIDQALMYSGGPRDVPLEGGAVLLMRADDDTRDTVAVKHELLSEVVRDIGAHRIVCGYDDRLDVVTMYKEAFGINGFVLDHRGVSDPLGNVAANMACIAVGSEKTEALSNEEIDELCDAQNATIQKKTDYNDVAGRLRDSADLVEGHLEQYGNAGIKAGDVLTVLFPLGVKATSAGDFRMFSCVIDLVAHLTNLVNSNLLDPNAAHGISANAAMIESEIMTAEKGSLFLGL